MRILWKCFCMSCGFFPLWSIEYHILKPVRRVDPWVFAHQTQALLLGVTAQCCHPEYYYHVNFLFSMYSLASMFFLIIPFFKKKVIFHLWSSINEMYFQNRSLRQFFRSFLKWLSHFNVSTKIKVILYPVYFAHSAISRLEIKARFNFAKSVCIYSGLIHSCLKNQMNSVGMWSSCFCFNCRQGSKRTPCEH